MSAITSRSNPKLFGHETAEARLYGDLARGTLAHGWIISGARGIGKATLAYRFARSLLSGEAPSRIIPDHPVFLRVAAGSHTDLLVVEPLFDPKKEERAREINVNQTREVSEFLSLTAGEGQWRVVIVDSADALNSNAANALLKILEEPPPQAILLLLAHNPGHLLPTIKSRCQHLALKALSPEQFAKVMAFIAPELDRETIKILGQLTDFSPGIALNYQESGAIDTYNQILDLLSALPSLPNAKLHGFADKMTQGQVHSDWQLLTRLLLCLLERAVLAHGGAAPEPISDKETEVFRQMQRLHPVAVWATKWQEISEQFSLAERLHLDYKQIIIIFFHSLLSKEEFRIGSVAA